MPTNDSSVKAQFHQALTAKLQVSIAGMTLWTKYSKNRCVAEAIAITGCYSCLTGCKVQLRCHSDRTPTMAHVECETVSFSLQCTPNGVTEEKRVHFQTSNVNQKCKVLCSGGSTSFSLTGDLAFVPKDRLGVISNHMVQTKVQHNSFDWSSIYSLFTTYYLIWMAIVVIILNVVCIAITVITHIMKKLV